MVTKRARTWLARGTLITVLAIISTLGIGTWALSGGVASELLLPSDPDSLVTVIAVDARSVTITADTRTVLPGVWGLATDHGAATLGDVVVADAWYAKGPFLKAVSALGWALVVVLKQKDYDIYQEAWGIRLPRNAKAQSEAGTPVSLAELQPGDLVFYDTLKRPYSHVGIYLGDGRFVHAPKSGAQVRVESLSGAYWTQRFNGARRIEPSL